MSHPEPTQPVHLKEGSELQTSGGQTGGMIRSNAIVGKCEGICASSMLAKAHSASDIHHHGDQDTIVYAVSGRGSIVSDGGKHTIHLEPGDFALIPAYMEHQEVNNSDEDVLWTIVRSGKNPAVTNLEGWGGRPQQ